MPTCMIISPRDLLAAGCGRRARAQARRRSPPPPRCIFPMRAWFRTVGGQGEPTMRRRLRDDRQRKGVDRLRAKRVLNPEELPCSQERSGFDFLPAGIRVVTRYRFGERCSIWAEVLLIDRRVVIDDEGHHA